VEQILAARSGQLILGGTSLVASIRALPTYLQEYLRDTQAQIVKPDALSAAA
jgi:hypothetical protein